MVIAETSFILYADTCGHMQQMLEKCRTFLGSFVTLGVQTEWLKCMKKTMQTPNTGTHLGTRMLTMFAHDS